MDIKDKLEQKIQKDLSTAGEFSLSSDSLKSFVADAAAEEISVSREPEVDKDTTTKLSDKIKKDPTIMLATENATTPTVVADLNQGKEHIETVRDTITGSLNMRKEEVTITSEEKHIFLDAVISNSRVILPFTLFDGRYTGEIRSRTHDETLAIFQQLNKELRDGQIKSQLAYSARLRLMLFAAQINMLNGTKYAELSSPLYLTVDGDETTPPGWLEQVGHWAQLGDGLIQLLLAELCLFEYKYLTMLDSAKDQNFWRTGLST